MIKKCLMVLLWVIPVLGISQLSGIWEVLEVKVGKEILTPQSKWFEFRERGALYGGNGGVINTRGSFSIEGSNVFILNENGEVDGKEGYLFRWDKFFVHQSEGVREWGIWHMHAHKPELRLMYFEEGKEDDLWNYNIIDDRIEIIKEGEVLFTLVRS